MGQQSYGVDLDSFENPVQTLNPLASANRLRCRTCSVYTTRPAAEMQGTKFNSISVPRMMHGCPPCQWQIASLRQDGNHLTTASFDAKS